MKNIKSILLLAFVSILLASCGGNDPLKAQVDAVKGQMPVKIADFASIKEVNYDKGMMTVAIDISETGSLTMDAIQKDSKNVASALGAVIFSAKGSLSALAPAIKQGNAAISLKLVGSNSKKSVEEIIPAAVAAKYAGSISPEDQLKNKIALDNLTIPYDVNDFLKHDKRTVEGNDVVFTLLVKGSSYDAKLNGKELKKFLVSIFTDPTDGVSDYPVLLVAANKGAKWIYKNEDTGAQLTSSFTVDELKELQKKE